MFVSLETEELAVRRILAVLVILATLAVGSAVVAVGGGAQDSADLAAGTGAQGSADVAANASTQAGADVTAGGDARDTHRQLLAAPVHLTADGVLVVWPGRGAGFNAAMPATSTLAHLRRRGADVPSVDQLFARYGRQAAYLLTVGRRPAADALIRAARRWRLDGNGGRVGPVQVATGQPAVARRLRRLAPGLPVVPLRRTSLSPPGQDGLPLTGAPLPPLR